MIMRVPAAGPVGPGPADHGWPAGPARWPGRALRRLVFLAGRAASSQPAPPVLTVRLTTLWAVPVGSALNTLGSRPCLSLLVAVSIGELMANDEAGRWLGQPNCRIGPGGPVDSDARGTVEHHCIRESLVQTKILLSNHRLVSACSCLLSLPGSRLFPCVHRAPLVARVRDISC